jgi:rubrerythrin
MSSSDNAEGGPDRAEPMPYADQDSGGDPVCWLDKVCPSCGLFTGDRPAATCPRCGEDLSPGVT